MLTYFGVTFFRDRSILSDEVNISNEQPSQNISSRNYGGKTNRVQEK